MTGIDLKKYIYENEKTEYVLENLGCHHIQYHNNKEYYSCANPDGDNNNAVCVYNTEYLNVVNYTRKITDKADLIDLVGLYKKTDFKNSLKWLHTLLGLKITYRIPTKKELNIPDPLRIFKKVKCRRQRVAVENIHTIDEEVLNDFIPYIHINWFREGIIKRTIDKFQLGYSYKRQRCIIPIRYWLTGELMGVSGRTMIEHYEVFDIPKFLAIQPYDKGLNLYGLWENYDSIQKAGYVIVYEAEKSVLKRHSRLDETGVALGCHTITDEQIKILIGLNVDIVIALDNDISEEETKEMCMNFKNIRNVYYMKDKYDLLGEKDSPADMDNKIFNFLFKHKVKV